jgi:hypothetical protein
MNKYRLISPTLILNELKQEIDTGILNTSNSIFCVKYWDKAYNHLMSNKHKEYITWENIERFESISHHEAIFLLLGLPTRFLVDYKRFDLYKPYRDECVDDFARSIFTDSIECASLDRSNLPWAVSSYLAEEIPGIYPSYDFIEWSLEKGFIEKVSDTIEDKSDNNPLGKYNDYRGWAKVHNTIATLVALETYEGNLPSNSSILNNDNFYNKLSNNLVSTKEGGIDKPKPKTLENYISEYNNFNK